MPNPKSILLMLLFYTAFLYSQEFVPVVKQFTKSDYNAGNQNWSVCQAVDGRMYFGNNDGLLRFDGIRWTLFKMPHNKTVRSVYADSSGRIYVGSFEEFGYFIEDDFSQLNYVSLSDSLKDYSMKNDEIWTIIKQNNKVYFQSFSSFFEYSVESKRLIPVKTDHNFFLFHTLNKNIYSYIEQVGYSKLGSGNKFNLMNVPYRIVTAFPSPKQKNLSILVSKSEGLFYYDGLKTTKFSTSIDNQLQKSEINRAILTSDGSIILGTILDGVYALKSNGELLWHLNTQNVLQNNTVLGLTEDHSGQIWIALDKGLAMVGGTGNVKWIPKFSNSVGAVYDAHIKSGKLYLATNQGLYSASIHLSTHHINSLELLSEAKGQVWDLSEFDGQIFCGGNEKTYTISNDNLEAVSSVSGGMSISKGEIQGRELLVQGTYSNICIYLKNNGKWQYSHALPGFINPVSHVEVDYTGRIWVSHLYKGLYVLGLSQDLKKISSQKYFPSLDAKNQLPVRLYKLNNRIVFTDSRKFYTYDDLADKIIEYNELNNSLGYFSSASRICHFRDNLYWFVKNKEAGLFQVNPSSTKLLDVVRNSNFENRNVDEYQKFIPLTANSCLITLENGLAVYEYNSVAKRTKPQQVKISQIQLFNDRQKVFNLVDLHSKSLQSIPFNWNNIVFSWYFTDYTISADVKFSYLLEGMDTHWSEAVQSGSKNYTYLPAGTYKFKVRALNFDGSLISETSFPFEVLQPFYWSFLARLIYLLIFASLLWFAFVYFKRKYQLKHERLRLEQEEIQKREIEKREQQITLLEMEKLEADLSLKSKELAQSTMTIINKNEILTKLRDELNEQKLKLGSQYPKKHFDKLMSMINENLSSEDDWNRFQSNFDMIHENFFRHLHRDFPELTPNDLRFCAYLRLNLTSKDIANLMNITLKGVEVARYRIRKKINLPSSKSLTEFMIEYK